MQQYSLYELNEYVRRVISLNFAEPVWIHGEIYQVSNSRGHFYIQLVQKDEAGEQLLARADAILWQRQYQILRRDLGLILDEVLKEGLEVLLQVRVVYDERYGLQYHIVQVDPAYSLGKLEIQRQESIKRLREEGLLEKNKSLPLPPVLQHIAILSSPEAAGLKDFLDQLHQNPFGYQFTTRLFPTAVQGQRVASEMRSKLHDIQNLPRPIDCIVIIRGGGSRLDLSAFDQYPLCKAVANSKLPVLSGIGHEVDETVVDLVTHTALKTPTAVAEYILNHNAAFELQVTQTGERIAQWALSDLQAQNHQLNLINQQIHQATLYKLKQETSLLEYLEQQRALLDPQNALDRGYAYITREGKSIQSIQELKAGERIRIHLKDGDIDSIIETLKPGS